MSNSSLGSLNLAGPLRSRRPPGTGSVHLRAHTHMLNINTRICVCVCVCVCARALESVSPPPVDLTGRQECCERLAPLDPCVSGGDYEDRVN